MVRECEFLPDFYATPISISSRMRSRSDCDCASFASQAWREVVTGWLLTEEALEAIFSKEGVCVDLSLVRRMVDFGPLQGCVDKNSLTVLD